MSGPSEHPPEHFLLDVRVQPRASVRKLKLEDSQVKAYLYSPPEGSKANTELIELFSDVLHVPKRNLSLVRGMRSRSKTVRILGITREKALALIAAASP